MPQTATPRRPGAQGMKRATDDATGIKLLHSKEFNGVPCNGRLYKTSEGSYFLCATCDSLGRGPTVHYREAGLDTLAMRESGMRARAA